jgi:16S rRNA U516 pseudouridylate synthase RsuA-like enzyme
MADTYEVLQPDGAVREFRADQFAEIRRVRSRAEHDQLIGQGWVALDEEVEEGEAPEQPAALEQAFVEAVAPPRPAPEITVYVLGRLNPREEGRQVV